jgi:DNA (cytosine-5)-methyltransferase 3A
MVNWIKDLFSSKREGNKKVGNILSLFDGMSCGQIALNKLGIKYDNFYASEIDKHAMKVTQHNFPDTIQIGDVTKLNGADLPKIHLLMGGSPCTNFSFSGKRSGMITKDKVEITTLDQYLVYKEQGYEFDGQSYLFWEFIRMLKEVKPTYFLLENVVMGERWKKILTEAVSRQVSENNNSDLILIEPIEINSSLVSAQNRIRLYWTNIPNIKQPEDKGIGLSDILESEEQKNPGAIRGRQLNKATILGRRLNEEGNMNIPIIQCLEVRATNTNKSNCLTTVAKDNVLTTMPIGRHPDAFNKKLPFRYYTTKEYCRLQTVPEDYFVGVASDNQIRKMIGNGWTVDVIAHILKNI